MPESEEERKQRETRTCEQFALKFLHNSDFFSNCTSTDDFIPDLLKKMKAPDTSSIVKLAAVEALQVFVGILFCVPVGGGVPEGRGLLTLPAFVFSLCPSCISLFPVLSYSFPVPALCPYQLDQALRTSLCSRHAMPNKTPTSARALQKPFSRHERRWASRTVSLAHIDIANVLGLKGSEKPRQCSGVHCSGLSEFLTVFTVRHIMGTLRQPQPFRDILLRLIANTIKSGKGGTGGWGVVRTPAKRKGATAEIESKMDIMAIAKNANKNADGVIRGEQPPSRHQTSKEQRSELGSASAHQREEQAGQLTHHQKAGDRLFAHSQTSRADELAISFEGDGSPSTLLVSTTGSGKREGGSREASARSARPATGGDVIGEEEEEDLLEETGPPTILSTILKAVKDESASVRLAALQILVKSECPAGLHPFCRALGDDDDNVQVAAAGALQEAVRRGHGQLVVDRLLSTATRSPSTQVREACLRSVIQDEFVGEERVIEGLRAMTSFGEASIRRLAVLGLGV